MTPEAWRRDRQDRVESALAEVFAEAWPPRFREACQYPLRTGGKRLRPLLCLAAAEAVGGVAGGGTPRPSEENPALIAAVALELLHTYSLVHDDLPCMDDDAMRRGRPTVHVVYGEGTAVLVGDALLTEAFATLGRLPPGLVAPMVRELAAAGGASGMIAGQALDIGLDGAVVDRGALERLHRAKTGALLRASVRMGGVAAGADSDTLAALGMFGDAVGLAFQIRDDVLDADQDAREGGPPSFVRLLGRDGAQALARAQADAAVAAVRHLPAPGPLCALAAMAVERDA